jgi:hypothetical protein
MFTRDTTQKLVDFGGEIMEFAVPQEKEERERRGEKKKKKRLEYLKSYNSSMIHFSRKSCVVVGEASFVLHHPQPARIRRVHAVGEDC